MVRYRTVIKRKGGRVVSVKTYTQSKSGKWSPARATASPAGATATQQMRTGGGPSTTTPTAAPPPDPKPTPSTPKTAGEAIKMAREYKGTAAERTEYLRQISEKATREEARRAVATERRTTPTKAKPPKKRKIELAKPKEPSTFWGKVQARYKKTEEVFASVTTKPVAKALKAVGVTKERVGKYAVKAFGVGAAQRTFAYGDRPSWAPSQKQLKLQREYQEGFVSGIATGLQKKPLKTAAVGAAFYVFPKVTAYAGLGAAKVAPAAYLKAAPALAATGKIASVGLAGAYGVQRYKEAVMLPPGRARGEFVGGVAATEIAPALIGGVRGSRAATSVRERATVLATAKTQLTPTQQTEFFKTLELAKTAKGKVTKVYKAPIEQVLARKEAAITRKFLAGKGKKAILYGSVAQKTQVTGKTLRQMRPSGDIDIAVKKPYETAVEYATTIYKATGVKPKIPQKALARGGLFGPGQEATVFVKGKAVTFHTKTSLEASPFYQGKPRKTPAGVYVQRIEEQLSRKVAGAMIRGRAKDIPDYKQISKSVAKQLKKQAPFKMRKELAEARVKGFEKIAQLPTMPMPKAKGPSYAYPKAPSYYPVPPTTYPKAAYDKKYGVPKQQYPVPTYRRPAAPYRAPSPRYPMPPYKQPTAPYTPPYKPTTPSAPYTPPTTTPPYTPPYRPPTPAYPTPPYRPPVGVPRIARPGAPAYRPRRKARMVRPRPTARLRFTQPKIYTPTLRATAFGIKAKKAPLKLTGLEERGLLK